VWLAFVAGVEKFEGRSHVRNDIFLTKIDSNGVIQSPVQLTQSSSTQQSHNDYASVVVDTQNILHVTWVNKFSSPYSQQASYQQFNNLGQPLRPVQVIGASSAIDYYDCFASEGTGI